MEQTVDYEVRGPTAYLTIDRPHRRNALDRATADELLRRVDQADRDPGVAVVVFRGRGDQVFCAGGDLKEAHEDDLAGRPNRVPMRGVRRNLCEAVLDLSKPTMAAINGDAYGAGAELCLACDLRYIAEHASFCLPEARRGTGATVGSVLLPRLLPRAVALELLFTGDPISAIEGTRLGLFNRALPVEHLDEVVSITAERIAGNAPLTIRRLKLMTTRGWELPVPAALRLDVGPDTYGSEDRKEGTRAFLERRQPHWRGV